MRSDLTVLESVREFPAVFPGNDTPQVRARVQTFYLSIAAMFERWIQRSSNANTRRSYREAVEGFISFMGIRWPDEDYRLVRDGTVSDVRSWRDAMIAAGTAPNMRNHRISALSRFYEYLQAQALDVPVPTLFTW